VVIADEQADERTRRADQHGRAHHRRDTPNDHRRRRRWCDQEREHEHAADRTERRHDREREQNQQHEVRELRSEADQASLGGVERADEQRPMHHGDADQDDDGDDHERSEIVGVDGIDRSEQEPREVSGAATLPRRHHDDGEREEADEQDADGGVVGER
jgi:hypothetical protein